MKKLPTDMTLEEKILYGFKIVQSDPKLRSMVEFLKNTALYNDDDIRSLIYEAIVKTERKMVEVYVWFTLFPLMLTNVIGEEMRREMRFYANSIPFDDINEYDAEYWLCDPISDFIKEKEEKERKVNIINRNTLFGLQVYQKEV